MAESSEHDVKMPPRKVADGLRVQALPDGGCIICIQGVCGGENIEEILAPDEARRRARDFVEYAAAIEVMAGRFRLAASWMLEREREARGRRHGAE